MAGALPHYKTGPATYTAAALILGGQLVRPAVSGDTPPAGLVGVGVVPCGAQGTDANANTVVGVAGADGNTTMFLDYNATYGPDSGASAPGPWPGDGSNANQDQLLDVSILGFSIPVWNNVDIPVLYATSATFGQLLVTGAGGTVVPYTIAGSNEYAYIVGRCTQPGGVTVSASPVLGRAFIRV